MISSKQKLLSFSALIFFLLLSSVIFSSCEKDITDETLNNKKWILTKIKTHSGTTYPIREIYIEFDDDIITGKDGCNSYWIYDFQLDGNEIEIRNIAGTLIYCGEDITDVEELYLKVLRSAERIKIIGNRLTISGDQGELRYKE